MSIVCDFIFLPDLIFHSMTCWWISPEYRGAAQFAANTSWDLQGWIQVHRCTWWQMVVIRQIVLQVPSPRGFKVKANNAQRKWWKTFASSFLWLFADAPICFHIFTLVTLFTYAKDTKPSGIFNLTHNLFLFKDHYSIRKLASGSPKYILPTSK